MNNSQNNSVVTSDRMDQWMYYTITISENTLTGYLNGKLVGSDEILNLTVSDSERTWRDTSEHPITRTILSPVPSGM